ncbi:MAG: hypothetical protein A2857_06610 [Candidatus Levybacteria bacterium RIFCSPHIGHO2_01_FULL_36_15]|nr:MAG: hypothetical protein A2857_06610 [Candidatus Levybacteria bacterium RIFCSPHIGHO2_01_FULL_36_15]OGH38808.1 MAG: hypothetical protein A2905_02505 [Candidatus Levybacteria bacterium RIFCSPLOWO2_01_FULL_36_10]
MQNIKEKFFSKRLILLIALPALVLLLGSLMLFSPAIKVPVKEECANSISCIKDLSGKASTDSMGNFMGKKVISPVLATNILKGSALLGTRTDQNKHIYIDLTNQVLYAYEGNKLIYSFLISSGKWRHTPTGRFNIWIKLRYTRMAGGDSALGTYYNLPNVPYTMYFYNDEIPKTMGFGLHGAYWHDNFGHPMSHGCVNMKTEDAEKIYRWSDPQVSNSTTYASDSNPGTPITIYGTTPSE